MHCQNNHYFYEILASFYYEPQYADLQYFGKLFEYKERLKMQSCMPAFCWFWICLKNPSLMHTNGHLLTPADMHGQQGQSQTWADTYRLKSYVHPRTHPRTPTDMRRLMKIWSEMTKHKCILICFLLVYIIQTRLFCCILYEFASLCFRTTHLKSRKYKLIVKNSQ